MTTMNPARARTAPNDWTAILFVSAIHVVAAFALVYLAAIHTSWWSVGLGLLWFLACGMAITAGYHRLFAHPTYKTNAVIRALHLAFGAGSAQTSALDWAAAHRLHHARVDHEDEDPYSIRRGFLWAHIGWIFKKRQSRTGSHRSVVKDLERDPLIRLQHRFFVPIALVMGLLVPAAIGWCWGDAIGAMLIAGPLRLTLQWHATWSVNSVAHTIGTRPYAPDSSARDSVWTALVTLGEGYHNFHHRFKTDYHNGVRWYHFDPTKWFVWSLAQVGLARDLRRVPWPVIEQARREAAAR